MPTQPERSLALQRLDGVRAFSLTVSSPSIHGAIPRKQSEYADGISPEIAWSRVEGAKSYALILEDPDAKSPKPFVHWIAWNIPGGVTSLPEGLEDRERVPEREGLLQGKNGRGSVGYFGPRPPVGDPPHHYHFQVFALDDELDVSAGADRDELIEAMQGHVLAAGQLVGTYQQETEPSS